MLLHRQVGVALVEEDVLAHVLGGREAGLQVAELVGDHPVARSLERLRAHHHVAPGRGQAVQEHHGDALARLLRRQPDAGALDDDLGHGLRIARGYHQLHGRYGQHLSVGGT